MKKRIIISLETLDEEYKKEKLFRFKSGYPLRFKRTKPRDEEKRKALIEFLIKVTPSAEDILSGKAFSELFK